MGQIVSVVLYKCVTLFRNDKHMGIKSDDVQVTAMMCCLYIILNVCMVGCVLLNQNIECVHGWMRYFE